ncbi:S-layer homology domain-containing protein [Paenibacillus sp. FJAT-27812]|uniref:S-layer homology domain-containing protein n=1 Tax=Paenibacillus sp. FJAT-27812 TaxID=1684143 RepID=UPI0006A7CB6B|nr:S-layer homology domain-containing protein [Paenibacillus sp. FJAT-27812]
MLRITRVITCLIIVSSLFWVTATTNSYAQEQEDEGQYEKLFNQPYEMKGHWAERLFQWAMAENIINGYPNSTLMPDKPISEAEFLKALYRAMGIALPSASSLEEFNSSDDWTEGAYRLAKYFNHPTLGASNHKLRMEPLTKLRAAEIITAAQGVHYVDEDAVVYLIGNGMANSDTISPEQFHGQDSFSRAEAIQWIRQLSFKGMMDISIRPTAASDRNLLPSLPSVAVQRIPDFSPNLSREMTSTCLEAVLLQELRLGIQRKQLRAYSGFRTIRMFLINTSTPCSPHTTIKKGSLMHGK